jgi:hypothetical protein
MSSASQADAGVYVCRLTPPGATGLGATLSDGANVTVVPAPEVLGADPSGRIDTYEGRGLALRGRVAATPPYLLEWLRDGSLVANGSELAIAQLATGDAGTYSIRLTQDGLTVERNVAEVSNELHTSQTTSVTACT